MASEGSILWPGEGKDSSKHWKHHEGKGYCADGASGSRGRGRYLERTVSYAAQLNKKLGNDILGNLLGTPPPFKNNPQNRELTFLYLPLWAKPYGGHITFLNPNTLDYPNSLFLFY